MDVAGRVATRVAIIGGGYAGMAAAVSLAERGVRSTVFEAAKVLGGRARRIDYRDEVLDNGQHILSGAYSELLRLMSLTGVSDSAFSRIPLRLSLRPQFALQAPAWIAPLHLAWALLTAKGLSFSDRLAAINFMRALKAANFRVEPGETVANLLSTHNQPAKLIQYLWQPLTISALNTPMHTASAQVFVNVLRDALASTREASDLILPQADLSALFPDAAARWLAGHGSEVLSGARVKSVSPHEGGFRLEVDNAQEDSTSFAAVVLAIGPHQTESLSLPEKISGMTHFSYEPIVTVYLKFSAPVHLPEAMFGQVDGFSQWFFDRRQLSTRQVRDPSEGGLIAVVISASGAHEELDNDALAARVLAELEKHTGALPALEWHKVITEKFATFACTPSIHASRPGNTTQTPGFFLAGDYTAGDYPATLEGAVRSGIRAANLAASHLSN